VIANMTIELGDVYNMLDLRKRDNERIS